MEEKEVGTIKKITTELIAGHFVYDVLFFIVYRVIQIVLLGVIGSSVIGNAIFSIIGTAFIAYFAWKYSIKSTFKKRSIASSDIKIVMRNILIYAIIVAVLICVVRFVDIKSQLDEAEKSFNRIASSLNSNTEVVHPYKKELDDAKSRIYLYSSLITIGQVVVFIGMVPLQKNKIKQYAV